MVKSALFIGIIVSCVGCVQSGIEDSHGLPNVDQHMFRCQVQPVLSARCSFMECHGNTDRALQLYAEQRFRIDPDWMNYETPLTGDELLANFQAVRSFIARSSAEPEWLTEKPLAPNAGGMYHQGEELTVTEDVFLSREDLGYQILRNFIAGATADPGCEPTQEVGL